MQLFCHLPPLYVGTCGLFCAWFRDYHEIFNLVPNAIMGRDFLGVFLGSRRVILSKKGRKVNIHKRWSVIGCIIVFNYFFPSLVLGREYFPAPLMLGYSMWLCLTNGIWANETYAIFEQKLRMWLPLVLSLCHKNGHLPCRAVPLSEVLKWKDIGSRAAAPANSQVQTRGGK